MTPMQEQYNNIKAEYEDAVILFRLGDFYETFDDDAVLVSKVLGITLTGRGKNETRRPMAGIPYHALPNYLPKLIEANLKIAIADQMEEPVAGKLVERKVTKLITPGTVLDENSLDSSKNNYIASLYIQDKNIALTYCDLSTGELNVFESNSLLQIKIEINKISPSEVVFINSQNNIFNELINTRSEIIEDKFSDLKTNYLLLITQFGTTNLKGFGIDSNPAIITSTGILIRYLKECQKTDLNHIKTLKLYNYSEYMHLDSETIRNLELIYPMNIPSNIMVSNQKTTLFDILNECETSMGKRKLRNWILNPLVNKEILQERIDSVDYFFANPMIASELKESLRNIIDIERVTGKIGVGNANPKDLYALMYSLEKALSLIECLFNVPEDNSSNPADIPLRLKALITTTQDLSKEIKTDVIDFIKQCIKEDPPAILSEGGFINDKYNNEVDELRSIRKDSKVILAKMQAEEIQKTGISSLKISFNNVFGYYIEVTRTHLNKVPNSYIRKQTLANAERFITEELKIIEEKILTSQEKLVQLENTLYKNVINKLIFQIPNLLKLAEIISEIDVLTGFGYIARKYQYCRPEITSGNDLSISNGRHPVVEKITKDFTPNSTTFTTSKIIHILTGPNMSGKSTYIRQVALTTLMAQIGSFVPADKMKFSIVNRIFTRVGASDNLSRGESTFMVEMNETANILNNASRDSLIILDEVGRGTSTYDGVAIAWSIIEYIAEKLKCKTLFATHYHELTELESKYDCIKNFNVEVLEENNEINFKHKIIEGAANKSYGIHVAKLAGVPTQITDRANEILNEFETSNSKPKLKSEDKRSTVKLKNPSTPNKIHPGQLGLI